MRAGPMRRHGERHGRWVAFVRPRVSRGVLVGVCGGVARRDRTDAAPPRTPNVPAVPASSPKCRGRAQGASAVVVGRRVAA